jgi:predicted ATPase/DNA-binding SARP family transcriptional activator
VLVEVRVLGGVELVGESGPIPLPAPKLRRLLAALGMHPGETRSTDVLIEALWDRPPRSARKLLQLYVSQLRRLLPAPARIVTGADGYGLELLEDALDSVRFERLLAEGRAALGDGNSALARSLLRRSLGLWRGAAYGEFAYEEFARGEAERLEELRLVATEERLEAELALGGHATLLPELRSLATAQPLRERLQAQAMIALYRCGRHREALDLYAALRARLIDELGLEPGRELRELQQRILQHDPSLEVESVFLGEASSLPTPPNRLLGRQRELAELETMLARDDVRLLVLTGAGGSGKTRLALELARRVAARYANGARLVDLAPLADPALVVPTIARALGIERLGRQPIETLVAEIRPLELLLLLDNAEHLRTAAPTFVQLLAEAPRLTLLVTSRAVLHLSGEYVYPVEPLAEDDACNLFLERARAAEPRFRTDDDDRETIAAICRRIDRLPLAVELAAPHMRTLNTGELLARLEERLPLLAGGPHDLPARQLTLRATIDWSVDLLAPLERRDLTRLSVFAGGCTVEAAEKVCETRVDRLGTLLEHNLLVNTASSEGSRYTMLETIREHALEQLQAGPEADEVRRRHALYFAAVAQAAGLNQESDGPMRHDLAHRERHNIRAALAWTLATGEIEIGLRIAAALENHWATSAAFEGAHWLDELLGRADTVGGELLARAVRARGAAALICGDTATGRRLYERSLREYERLGDERGIGILQQRLALEDLREGEIARARQLAEESLRLHRKIAFGKGEAIGLGVLARIEQAAGHRGAALTLSEQSLQLAVATGFVWWRVQMLRSLAELMLDEGNSAKAESCLREAIPLLKQANDRYQSIAVLARLASIAAQAGDSERAGRIWGAVEGEEARAPTGAWQTARELYAQPLLAGSDPAFETSRLLGRQLSLDSALADAAGSPPPPRAS